MTKNKLLLVDNEVDITSVFKAGLERYGYEVDIFNDPEQALMLYKPNHYDAIILDVRMVGMTGFELAREIWARESRATICFLSAFEIYESEARKVFANMNSHCFIKKPIEISALAKHVESHLSAPG